MATKVGCEVRRNVILAHSTAARWLPNLLYRIPWASESCAVPVVVLGPTHDPAQRSHPKPLSLRRCVLQPSRTCPSWPRPLPPSKPRPPCCRLSRTKRSNPHSMRFFRRCFRWGLHDAHCSFTCRCNLVHTTRANHGHGRYFWYPAARSRGVLLGTTQ